MDTDELLQMFQSITTNDHDALVNQFSKILQIDNQTACFFLESSNWNVETAVNMYLSTVAASDSTMMANFSNPQMIFLTDLSPLQSKAYAPGEKLTMIWSFQNVGTDRWPADARLIFLDGCDFQFARSYPMNMDAGVQFDLRVTLVMPMKPGSYAGSWRLTCASGFFGEPIWIILNVQDMEVDSADNSTEDAMMDLGELSVSDANPATGISSKCDEDMDL